MTKFKVGDKVRLIKGACLGFKVGDVHTITKVFEDGAFNTKENEDRNPTLTRPFHSYYWELVEETHFPLYSEEAAVKLLTERGYEVKAPPEPLKGKVVIYDSCVGVTSCSYEQWNKYNNKKDCRLIAIVDWTEGQGI